MHRKFKAFLVLCLSVFFFPIYVPSASAVTQESESFCSQGTAFYRQGQYNSALEVFQKAIAADSGNKTAKGFIDIIFQKDYLALASNDTAKAASPVESPQTDPIFRVTGETQVRVGFTGDDFIWKRANWDLNEKNWRITSGEVFNRTYDTFDTRIYDRLRVNVDGGEAEGFGFHTNITVDPWSYRGKSAKLTLTSGWQDTADVQLKYWANTGYTINDKVNTTRFGNSFNLPEIKLEDGTTPSTRIRTAGWGPNWWNYDFFTIPPQKIHFELLPFREAWVDYNHDPVKIRVFPIAYENQAVTFDDPLVLSNNRTWWEDSPWIRRWTPGILNYGATPRDFTRGHWDNTISFFARDSEGIRLTALRGLTLAYMPFEGTSLSTAFAAPQDPWQDYTEADNIISATRFKQSLADKAILGVTYTTRTGFDVNNNNETDARNYVAGADVSLEIREGLVGSLETAHSRSNYDLTHEAYENEKKGNVYYVSVMGRYPQRSIVNQKGGYEGIQAEQGEDSFSKFRLFGARMDNGFDASLSSYLETRDDEFWSRHIHFRSPDRNYYIGFYDNESLTWYDIRPFRIGNGIDINRNTIGFRMENFLWNKKVEHLFDLRNVNSTNGEFIENVTRDELTVCVNERITLKTLGIYQAMPRTKPGIDPFIINPVTRAPFQNSYVLDDQDPSVKTGSLGMEYKFFDWLALNGTWEHTNDYYLGYDSFPRGILNGGNNSLVTYADKEIYRDTGNWLLYQYLFPNPPYPYYDIFKSGLRINPFDKLELYLDYTYNEYQSAGQVDDNMNHVGIEATYSPLPKLRLILKYTYSRWQDLDRLVNGITKPSGHHNVFMEFMYKPGLNQDFVFQYGEASRNPLAGEILPMTWDPYGGSLRTIDTQHIFRLYYRRRF